MLFIFSFTTEAHCKGFFLFIVAAGRVAWLKFCQSISIAAAYIKEVKPAHGYLALVVVVDTAPHYTWQT